MLFPPPLGTQELLDRFAKFERRSINPKVYRRKHNVVDLRVTYDATGQAKVKLFGQFGLSGILSRITAESN